ncbi:MAG TPA: hypothetical protein PKA06_11030, partial [Gemmatales bacterium]|nr:hypothetical protein [Gemmatales bacterium]
QSLVVASEHVTANFIVRAANPQIAQKVGEYAERWRRDKALEWLGREMPTWGKKCPLTVNITPSGSSGETRFAFDNGSILDQQMEVSGTLERILNSVLPHEITHTVFAYRFRKPLPRWADEGGSVLSEDEIERRKHDDLIRRYLAKGNQAYRLRTLMTMMQYPSSGEDVITLYAEGYSVVRFLVESSNRQVFLDFLHDGMLPTVGWDRSLQKHYGLRNIEQLEQLWLKWMVSWCSPQARLNPQGSASTIVASNTGTTPPARADVAPVRENAAIIRGSKPEANLAQEYPATYHRESGRVEPGRAWSPTGDEPAPVSTPATATGWRPVRASLGQPIPQ